MQLVRGDTLRVTDIEGENEYEVRFQVLPPDPSCNDPGGIELTTGDLDEKQLMALVGADKWHQVENEIFGLLREADENAREEAAERKLDLMREEGL